MLDSLQPHELEHARLPSFTISQSLLKFMAIEWMMLSHLLSPPSPFSFNLSQNQSLIQWVGSLYQVTKVLELLLQHQSFQWYSGLISFRIDWFNLLAVQGTVKSLLQQPQFESTNSLALRLIYCPTLTSIHDNWKNHSIEYTDLCQQVMSLLFNMLSKFAIAFLLRRNSLLNSWLQSLTTVILEPKKRKSVTASTFSCSIGHEVIGPDAMILIFWWWVVRRQFLSKRH